MPVREHTCETPECQNHGRRIEHWYKTSDPAPLCRHCGQPAKQLVSSFAIPCSGLITSRYNDSTKDGAHADGHWAFALNTPDGKPREVFIDTFEKQREFCKQEGLRLPGEVSSYAQVGADGKSLQTMGMPGQWHAPIPTGNGIAEMIRTDDGRILI